MSKLLLLEDNTELIDGLSYSLKKNGFDLQIVQCVKEAKAYVNTHQDCNLMLLDVTLPDGTGFEFCEYVREKGDTTPIIFLTAADEEYNIIRGLDSGGDDYITKPFKIGELCSRIKAILRRSLAEEKEDPKRTRLVSGDLVLDLLENRAFFKDKPVELTVAEFRLLGILLRNKNHIVTRQMIFDSLWDGNGDFVDDNTLSVYIRRLREKLEDDPSKPRYIKTARGFGYSWEDK